MNSPHVSGVIVERVGYKKAHPNSGVEKVVKVKLKKTGKVVLAYVPGDGTIKALDEGGEVTLEGGSKTYGNSGAKYKVVKLATMSMHRIHKEILDT
jgi:ribosomal protein S12